MIFPMDRKCISHPNRVVRRESLPFVRVLCKKLSIKDFDPVIIVRKPAEPANTAGL